MSKTAFGITLTLTLLAGVLFAWWPELDLSIAGYFFGEGPFAGRGRGERLLRQFFYYGPLIVPLAFSIAWLLTRLGLALPAKFVPANRTMIYLFASLLLAPALLVNGLLKEHSNRPRPNQLVQFGGKSEFRPWHRFDGACISNCSFVSGEVSTSAWLAAPASLLPAPWKAPAIAAAIVFAAATGALRMAFGGHFMSDVAFAILFTLLICQGLHLLLMRGRSPGT